MCMSRVMCTQRAGLRAELEFQTNNCALGDHFRSEVVASLNCTQQVPIATEMANFISGA